MAVEKWELDIKALVLFIMQRQDLFTEANSSRQKATPRTR